MGPGVQFRKAMEQLATTVLLRVLEKLRYSSMMDFHCFNPGQSNRCWSLSCAGSAGHTQQHRQGHRHPAGAMAERVKPSKVWLYLTRIDADNACCHSATCFLHVRAGKQAILQNIQRKYITYRCRNAESRQPSS